MRRIAVRAALAACACITLTACATATTEPRRPIGEPVPGTEPGAADLPPIPLVDGPLQLEVGYPPEGATIAVRDSNFIFGSTGSGRTSLTINGRPAEVAPNGGFLAFIPVPPDGVYRLNATKDGQTASLERRVNTPTPASPTTGFAITGVYPAGVLAITRGETFEVGFRAPPGARANLILPDGTRVPLVEQGAVTEVRPGDEFRTQAGQQQRPPSTVRYTAVVAPGTPILSTDTSIAAPRIGRMHAVVPPPVGNAPRRDALIEVIAGTDTVRTPLRLNVALLDPIAPRVGIVTPPADAPTDWTVRGRVDIAGPFHFFWPPGTRLTITGQRGGMYRVQLTADRSVYVPVDDVRLLPEGASPGGAAVNAIRLNPEPDYIDVRIPAGERLPFQIVEEDAHTIHVDVFGAVSRINFFQYGGLDPLVERASWSQPADSVLRVTVKLTEPLWGFHPYFDQSDALILRIRRPPDVDLSSPLRGLLIAVDPGHGGGDRATRGPTGLTEADANLGIALQLRDLLRQRGASVFMTRTQDTTVALGDRPRLIAESGAHISISVHNNAFPDGVNPWENNGTSVYYFHPHSVDLAQEMQREILAELGLRDIGYGRADLALVRTTWMPAVLTETAFMMIPQQEAALRDPAVQRRIAQAHVRALETFLLSRARD